MPLYGNRLAWHASTGSPAMTFLVHGETETMQHFAGFLGKGRVELPALNQGYDL